MKQSRKIQERIKEYNIIQIEERQDLPNLFEAIKMAQEGDAEIIGRFFYGYKVIERLPSGGKMRSYEVDKVRFWDKQTDIFLTNLKKRYTKDIAIGEQNSFGDRKLNYKYNVSNFEESEIDDMFFTYMLLLVEKIKLDKFIKETESKTLNAIRKYIRVDFENNFLKKESNERIGLERVQVDGKMYWVKNKEEEVFFDDINCGQDEEGERVNFLDVVGSDDIYTSIDIYDLIDTSKKFIEENLEDALTKNQYEKWEMLVEHVNEHGIESILDKYTGKIKKTTVARIFYPNKSERSTTVINKLIERMNNRIETKLEDAGIKFISAEEEQIREAKRIAKKSGAVEVYTGGFTEEEVEKYFQQHIDFILKSHIEGRLTWDKGTNTMLPSLELMNELSFDVYEKWLNSGMNAKKEIIKEYYNTDKFKMKAGKKKVIKTIPVQEYEEKNDKYITPEQLKEIRRQSEINKLNQ